MLKSFFALIVGVLAGLAATVYLTGHLPRSILAKLGAAPAPSPLNAPLPVLLAETAVASPRPTPAVSLKVVSSASTAAPGAVPSPHPTTAVDSSAPAARESSHRYPRVELKGAIGSAVRRYDPTFKVHQTGDYGSIAYVLASAAAKEHDLPSPRLSLVNGDFNGDGRSDAIIHGYGKQGDVVLSVMSSPQGYEVTSLSGPRDPDKKLYGTRAQWKSGMLYLMYRKAGAIFLEDEAGAPEGTDIAQGGVKRVVQGTCPHASVTLVLNSEGEHSVDYCYRDHDWVAGHQAE